MAPLPSELRGTLEKTIIAAREAAETAAKAALSVLAVDRDRSPAILTDEQKQLRNALRARMRQLGQQDQASGLQLLIEEIAYEQWHRMLFARFLAENSLLMHPDGISITLADCAELAPEEGEADAWQLAARYASSMLPGIFRRDDPAVQVRFAPEGRRELERILANLPASLFTADDALGWVYQFWQTKRKKEVNESGRKIGGADLAPVTQLFTEHYMVQFLLENSLGAWWAARHPSSPLLKQFEYLRFRDDGTPAAGAFPGWPERAAEVTIMDPCCGSGHFLVAAFELLRRMRMEEESISEADAAEAVLRDNLFGLELDPRCTQIAAFALALAAWRVGGYRSLPLPNIACSGIAVEGQLDDWTKLATDDDRLHRALERLYHLFRNAPDLGSLINPADVPLRDRMFIADYVEVAPLLTKALLKEQIDNRADAILGIVAEGVIKAAQLLAKTYTLVATNVPYLVYSKQDKILKEFCRVHHPNAKADLSTTFLERCDDFITLGGTYAVVTPQNWLSLGLYKKLREQLLREREWNLVVPLGPAAFHNMNWPGANTALQLITKNHPPHQHKLFSLDVSESWGPTQKDMLVRTVPVTSTFQSAQLQNPDSRIVFTELTEGPLLADYANSYEGIGTGDLVRFTRHFWELKTLKPDWEIIRGTTNITNSSGGLDTLIFWQNGSGDLVKLAVEMNSRPTRGYRAWGKRGVAVNRMGDLCTELYNGEIFDCNIAAIIPKNEMDLSAIWHFCKSEEYCKAVRSIDQALKVTNVTLLKVHFDLKYWQKIAETSGPLPEPSSDESTQWLFKGKVASSIEPLHVAVARLVGYQWPQQEKDGLDNYVDSDGIVCLLPLLGEPPAYERVRALLATAYGSAWSPTQQDRLLTSVGFTDKGLEGWLRDGFFTQHCRLFHNRPFIWHIWDGLRDGFSVLVNYHKLDSARLNKLIYTYLGAWIADRRAERDAGVAGAEGKLVAALNLQKKLEAIRDGEPPYDIYVRWKPLHQQPIGWNPDLNDGVRLNIRPFVTAGVLRSRFTINWNKDRGANPDGSERLNDLHYTIAKKQAARREVEI